MQTRRTVSASQCAGLDHAVNCFQPPQFPGVGSLSHAHPPHPQSPPMGELLRLRALVDSVTIDIQLSGFASQEHASYMYFPQVRRSPSTTEAVGHLETVSRWKDIGHWHAVEIVLWERLFRQCLALRIEEHLRGFLVVYMSVSPVNEISLLPRLVDCLPAADGLPIKINIPRLIRDMIERFFVDHPSETAYRNFHWSIHSKDLPTFVFDFIRTHDCFHAGPNVVVTYPAYQYTDRVLSIVTNLEWQGPDIPKVVRQGSQYCIECPPAKSNSSVYWGSPGFKFSPAHIDFTTSKTSSTVITTVIAMHFPGNVQHLRISRYKIKEPTSWVLQNTFNTATSTPLPSPKKRKASQSKTTPATMNDTFAPDKLKHSGPDYVPKRRKTSEGLDSSMPQDRLLIRNAKMPIDSQLLCNPILDIVEQPERDKNGLVASFEKHSEHRLRERIVPVFESKYDGAVTNNVSSNSIGWYRRPASLPLPEMEVHPCIKEQGKLDNKKERRRHTGTGSMRRQFRSPKVKGRATPIFSWNLPVREKKSSSLACSPESPLSPTESSTTQHHPLSLNPPSPPRSEAPAPPNSPDTEASSDDSPATETMTETAISVPTQEEIQTNYKEFEKRKMSAPKGLQSPTAAEWDKWWYESGEGESGFSGLSGIESGSDIDKSALLED